MVNCCNCDRDLEGSDDTVFCENCHKFYCDECSERIHSINIFKAHKTQKSPQRGFSYDPCPLHGKRMDLFCDTCHELCCYKCACLGNPHSQHRTCTVPAAYTKKLEKIGEINQKLEGALDFGDTSANILDAEISALDAARGDELDVAEESYGRLQDALAEREQGLNEDVAALEGSVGSVLEGLLVDVRELCDESDAVAENVEAVIGEGDSEDGIPDMFALIGMSCDVESTIRDLNRKRDEILKRMGGMLYDLDFAAVGGDDDGDDGSGGDGSGGGSDSDSDSSDDELDESLKRLEMMMGKLAKAFGDLQKNFEDAEGALVDKISKFGVVTKVLCSDPTKNENNKIIIKIKRNEEEKEEKEEEEKGKEVIFDWESIIPHFIRIVADENDDLLYVLKVKQQISGEDSADDVKYSDYSIIYKGKSTSYTHKFLSLKGIAVQVLIQTDDGSVTLWASQEVFVSLTGYNGSFKPTPRVKVLDTNRKVVLSTKRRGAIACDVPLTPGITSTIRYRVLKTDRGDNGAAIGVAPESIDCDREGDMRTECGWYFNFYETALYSGPPQNISGMPYGRRNDIKAGDIITLVVDLEGEYGVMSVKVNDKDFGVAFKDIPLDVPLVPVVYFYGGDESIALLGCNDDGAHYQEVYGNVDASDSDSDTDTDTDTDSYYSDYSDY